jgi:hypothetical protein
MNQYVVSIIILFGTYTLIFWQFRLDKSHAILSYFEVLYHLGFILAAIGLILNQTAIQKKDNEVELASIIRQQEYGFIDTEQFFINNYPHSFPLYKEMNRQNRSIQRTPIPDNIDPIRRSQIEASFSNIIFQKIENNLSLAMRPQHGKYLHSNGFREWIITWKQWLKSPTLRKHWSNNKYTLFSENTRNFIDNNIIT